jgi:hypothetical protein
VDNEKVIAGAYDLLARADQQRDPSKSLGAVILACGKLLEIIEDQQEQIEELRGRLDEDPSAYDLRKGRQ